MSIKYGFLRFTDHSVFIYILHSVLVFLEVGMYFRRWLEIFDYCWRRAQPNKTLQSGWYLQDTSRCGCVFCLARWKMLIKDRTELQEKEPNTCRDHRFEEWEIKMDPPLDGAKRSGMLFQMLRTDALMKADIMKCY